MFRNYYAQGKLSNIGPLARKIFFWTDLKSDGGQGMIHQDITYYDRAPKDKGNISGI